MANYNQAQATELEKMRKERENMTDMMRGCVNRMCVTDDREELDHLFIAMIQYTDKLYAASKRRIYVQETPDFDRPKKLAL